MLKSYLYPKNLLEAREIQLHLEKYVLVRPLPAAPRLIAGADAWYVNNHIVGAVCLFSYPKMEPVEVRILKEEVTLPYRAGFLSFREGPVLWKACLTLERTPDIILFDGQGIAHPLRMGLASYVGVLLGIPTVGCAKSRLVGAFRSPGPRKGSRADLVVGGESVGTVLRTRTRVRPVFVSPGHLIDISGAAEIVLRCSPAFRIPEPIRAADRLARSQGIQSSQAQRTGKVLKTRTWIQEGKSRGI